MTEAGRDTSLERSASPVPVGWGRGLILSAAILCGAAVMEVEVLGARVISPWFGVGLFVWTALITVTLISLAAGYYIGGQLADRGASLRLMALLVGGAGLALIGVPLLRIPVLRWSLAAGVRGGALLGATLLFAPALTLLGTVTPLAVKLFLRDVREAGRTVGRLSALSTLGSFAGTVATGFWIIPAFHVDQIAAGTGGVLLALAGLLLAVQTKRVLPILIFLPALLLLRAPELADVMQRSGTRARVVLRTGSFYGQISVVDYTFPPRHTREMLVDGIIEGGIDLNDGRSIYPFTYCLEYAALRQNPEARRALVIGLGPGSMPARLAQYGLTGAVVEIDPKIAELARSHFGYKERGFPVVIQDGRAFIGCTGERFDLVLLDAFSAENEPDHLMTQEAFAAIAHRLNPDGALAVNLPGRSPGPGVENAVVDTVLRTMRTVFPTAYALYLPGGSPGNPVSFTLVAALGPSPESLRRALLPPHPMAEKALDRFLDTRYATRGLDGPVYTDGWVPLEAQNADLKLLWRRMEIASTPAEILLN